jgi:hypothetical protein
MPGPDPFSPLIYAQTALTAVSVAAQLMVSQKAAKLAELQGEIAGVTSKINAEMQAFELEQGIINKETEAFFEGLNLEVDEFTKDYVDRYTKENVLLNNSETDSIGIMAELKEQELSRQKQKVIRNTGIKISDLNRQGDQVLASTSTSFAANNVAQSSLSQQAIKGNITADVNRAAALELMEAGDAMSGINAQILSVQAEGAQAKFKGARTSAEIEKIGAETIFGLQQKMINSKSRISALNSEATNMELTADLVRTSGVASANAAIAAGALNASQQRLSGVSGAISTLSSGFSSAYQTYATNKQMQLTRQQAAMVKSTSAPTMADATIITPSE